MRTETNHIAKVFGLDRVARANLAAVVYLGASARRFRDMLSTVVVTSGHSSRRQ